MAFFKRVEVWVLVLLTVGGGVAVLRMDQATDKNTANGTGGTSAAGGDVQGAGGSSAAAFAATARYQLASLQLERDGDHAVLEIRLSSDEDAPEPAKASGKRARLLRADGSEVAEFFAPFAAGVASEYGGESDLLFWADRSTLAGELFLEFGEGQRLKVKDADGFQLDSVEDGGRKNLS